VFAVEGALIIFDMVFNMEILMFHSFIYPVKCHWKLYVPQDVKMYKNVLLTDCAYLCFFTTLAKKSV
jgi:hypothetical protein